MIASAKSKNGVDISLTGADVEQLITRFGLQECWLLSRHLLAYAMVGDEKKQQLRNAEPNRLTQLITEPFLLESSKNRRLLWAYHLVIFGACACINFSLYFLLFA